MFETLVHPDSPTESLDQTPNSSLESLQQIPLLVKLREQSVASWCERFSILDRRSGHRLHYGKLVTIRPVDSDGKFIGEAMQVVGRDISLDGLSICYRKPIPHRYVAVSFDEEEFDGSVLLELRWCRFTRDHLYQCGGRFL